MAYTPDATNALQPADTVKASTAAAEFRSLKGYIALLAGLNPAANGIISINGGPIGGLRNRVINGNCRIKQRANGVLSNNYAMGAVDRYLIATTGTGVSGSVQALTVSGLPSGGVCAEGSWTAGAPQIEYRIESANTLDISGKNVTISCKLYHNFGSTRTIRIRLNRPDTVDVFSPQTEIATSGAISVPSGVVTAISFTTPVADASKGLAIQVYDDATSTVVTKIFGLGELQLEIGSVATLMEHRPVGLELALCQPYFEKSYNQNVAPGTVTPIGAVGIQRVASASADAVPVRFAVTKRANPIVKVYSEATGAVGNVRNYSAGADVAATVSGAGESGAVVNFTFPIGAPGGFHFTADAEL